MMKKHPKIQNHQVMSKKKQRRNLWHQFLENTLPKESIETKKVKNAPPLIIQSEPPAPE